MKNSTKQIVHFYLPFIYLLVVTLTLIVSCTKDNPVNDQITSSALEERAVITYNEGLASVFRGIITDRFSRNQKYYRIREFRVQGQPEQTCITLNILKNYGELVAGKSVLPKSGEKYVFNRLDTAIIQPSYRIYQVRDAYNNILRVNMNLVDSLPASCWNTTATLTNKPLIKVTTQTYITQIHNTCGVTEPAWTVVK